MTTQPALHPLEQLVHQLAEAGPMAPVLTVAPHLVPVLHELERLEPLFHAAHADANLVYFDAMVPPDFWEVGASGRRYGHAFVRQVLAQRAQAPDKEHWRTGDFHIAEAGVDHYLLTYTLHQPGRITRRLTVWRRAAEGWQALYHQGTVVQP